MQDDIFVIDGVAHAFNMADENLASERYAGSLRAAQGGFFAFQPPGYNLEPERTFIDWTVEDTANILFRESRTDVAIFHPVPIYFFKDGLSSIEKAVEATNRWPNRFVGSYVAVDPLRPDPLGELERQVELLENPIGVKLYPVSYVDHKCSPWRMDDPKIGFPIYEKVRELGLKHVAIHKSLPIGATPGGTAFSPGDVEGAADAFPDLIFSIVHGGMSFNEETAWLLSRFPNIWINLESFNIIAMLRPHAFGELLAGLLSVAGEAALDRIYWASGAMNCHPRPGLEAFMDFQFTEEQMERYGIFFPIPQLTHEHKRKLLGGNLARLHGLDISELAQGIVDDEFATDPDAPLPTPYSTTALANAVTTPFDPARAAGRSVVGAGA
jgi:predicted TIM-barrel fold metal-dependent hydrolase